MGYGERFRKHRKLISQVLNSQAVSTYRDVQANNAKALLRDLLDQPEKFDHLVLRFVINTSQQLLLDTHAIVARLILLSSN